jgi:hypothetical protein
VDLFGIRLIGANSDTLTRLALSVVLFAGVMVVRFILVRLITAARGGLQSDRITFWVRQGTSLTAFAFIVVGLLSIWFDDAREMRTVLGFVTAGVAIASQRAITAFAGYLVIMRGRNFTVGDRIKMGGVQGDVIALGFFQTRIFEMGQPPDVTEQEPPGMWVHSRQFTGRIVTITNDKITCDIQRGARRLLPADVDRQLSRRCRAGASARTCPARSRGIELTSRCLHRSRAHCESFWIDLPPPRRFLAGAPRRH